MRMSKLYKNFGTEALSEQDGELSNEALEDAKLQSFEEGYKSGWDDAVAAQRSAQDVVGEALSLALQDASFSYVEARSVLLKQLRNEISPVIQSMLPGIAKPTIHQHIMELIDKLASEQLERPIEVTVSPSQVRVLRSMCESSGRTEVKVTPDETLIADQIFIRIGETEKEMDFGAWLEEAKNSVAALFDGIDGGS